MANKNSLVSNSVFFVCYKLFNALLPLITSSIIARVLFPEGVGQIAVAQNHVTYFTYVAALGLPIYGTREMARVREDYRKDIVFSELFSINFISTIICLVVYCVMFFNVFQMKSDQSLHLIFGSLILFNLVNVDWVYQGFEQYKYISIRSFIVKLMCFIFTVLFVKEKSDITLYAVILCVGTVGNYIFNVVNLIKKRMVRLRLTGICLSRHMKPLMILFVSSIAIELYTLVDTTMLGLICTNNVIGYYTNAMKLVRATIVCFTAVSTVTAPQISHRYGSNDVAGISSLVSKVMVILVAITVPATIGMALTSDYIMITLFGEAFAQSAITLSVLAFLLVPVTISTFFGNHVLCSINHEKDMLFATIAGAISNIVLNAMLIQVFQQNGAAIASVISEWIVVIFDYVCVAKVLKIQIDKKSIFSVLLGSCAIVLFIFIMRMIVIDRGIKLVLIILGSCLLFFILMIVMKNSISYLIFDMLNRRRNTK